MKKKIFYISAIVIFAFALILGVQYFKSEPSGSGFERKYKSISLNVVNTFKMPSPHYYFAGISEKDLYFKDLNNSNILFSVNQSLSVSNKRNTNLSPGSNIVNRRITLGVSDTAIYALDYESGALAILSNKTNTVHNYKSPGINLNHGRLISPSTIVAKSANVNNKELQRNLTKYNYFAKKIDKYYILEKQVDGYFCTDGMLHFDPSNSRIFYGYFYRGQFLCLDTNLNLLYKSKTIDTVTRASMVRSKISSHKDKDKTLVTQAAPPKIVNKNFIIFNDSLYMMSAVKADNEKSSDFLNNQVIDVYLTSNGQYQYSFYIPEYKGEKIREFRMTAEYVFAIFNSTLVKYKISRSD